MILPAVPDHAVAAPASPGRSQAGPVSESEAKNAGDAAPVEATA